MKIKMGNDMATTALSVLPSKGYNEVFKEINIYRYMKRFLDIVIASIGLIILSPVFLVISILIKIESPGPVFFGHKRIGKNGKEFKLWKFRSMVENAEELIKNFTPEQMKEFKENFKLENDPRVTKIGKILRKTSLDELPQLINIIKGDLSIIGPRPVIGEELNKYRNNQNKFFNFKSKRNLVLFCFNLI